MNTSAEKKIILLYDGTCGLCHWAVNLCRRHIVNKKSIRYLAQESEEGKRLIQEYKIDLNIDSIYLINNDVVLYKSKAAFHLIRLMNWKVKWLVVLDIFPRSIMDRCYTFVAKHRKKIFGEVDSCEI